LVLALKLDGDEEELDCGVENPFEVLRQIVVDEICSRRGNKSAACSAERLRFTPVAAIALMPQARQNFAESALKGLLSQLKKAC
jgi:hypothetical protein